MFQSDQTFKVYEFLNSVGVLKLLLLDIVLSMSILMWDLGDGGECKCLVNSDEFMYHIDEDSASMANYMSTSHMLKSFWK